MSAAAIPPASMRRLNALGSVTPCTVCGEPSLDGIHPNCAEPSAWPEAIAVPEDGDYVLTGRIAFDENTRTRRCEGCHGKGWTLPTDTRPQCTRCAGAGTITWRNP